MKVSYGGWFKNQQNTFFSKKDNQNESHHFYKMKPIPPVLKPTL